MGRNRREQTIVAPEAVPMAAPGVPLASVGALRTRPILWAQRLGHARRDRDESAAQLARSQQADAAHAAALSTDRWVRIVAAIRRQAEAYNAGAHRIVLNVVEHSGRIDCHRRRGRRRPALSRRHARGYLHLHEGT